MPSFVDVDFTTQPQYVQGYTVEDVKRFQDCKSSLPKYADNFEVLSDSDLKDAAAELAKIGGNANLITRIFDQGNEGSCVGNAFTQGHQVCQARLAGKHRVIQMSAMSLYKQIGSSPNSGANIGDAMERLQDTGLLPLDTEENIKRFKHTMSHRNFRQPWPSGWKETAALFSNLECFVAQSAQEALTAIARGRCVGVGRAGHSILYMDYVWEDGGWLFEYVNSWTEDWGYGKAGFNGGFGRDSRRLFNEACDWCVVFEAIDPSRLNVYQELALALAL